MMFCDKCLKTKQALVELNSKPLCKKCYNEITVASNKLDDE